MSNIPLSKHFFYFLAKKQYPPDYKPVLQILVYRTTKNGLRLKIYDGFFISNACYCHNPDLTSFLEQYDRQITPIIRVTDFDSEGLNNEQSAGRPVLNILNFEVLDADASAIGINTNYPISESAVYDEYMSAQILEPQGIEEPYDFAAAPYDNEQAQAPTIPEYDSKPTPAKRARIAQPVAAAVPKPSAALTAYRDPSKIGVPSTTSHAPYNQRTADAFASGDQNITPITLITPFLNRWRICGLCTLKKLRDVNSAQKGPMRVLEFHLSDETGKTIKMTAWNEQADEVDAVVNDSQMYYVSGDQGCIRKKNIRFNYTDCDYEINLNRNCQVAVCNDRIYEPPKFSIKRKLLSDVSANEDTVDVMVVVEKIGEISKVLVKVKNEEVSKRDIVLVDESCTSINLTVWDDKADKDFIGQIGDVIGIKHVKVKEFNGSISLSLIAHSSIEVHPEVPGMNELHTWYENERPTAEIKSLSVGGGSNANFAADFRSLGAIKNSAMIDSIPHGVYVYAKCEIIEVRRDNPYYSACAQCNKKVQNSENGIRCEKCNTSNPVIKQRYMLNVNLSDGLDSQYVTLFDEQATSLLGIDAERLDEIRQRDDKQYNAFFDPILFQSCIVRMRVQNDYYNDQQRKKFTVYQVKPVPYPQYETCLNAALEKLENL
jgi:replication factor A1